MVALCVIGFRVIACVNRFFFGVFCITDEVFMSGECHRILRYWYHYVGDVDVVIG